MTDDVPAAISLKYAIERLIAYTSMSPADAKSVMIDALLGAVIVAEGVPAETLGWHAHDGSHEVIRPDWWRAALNEQASWSWSGSRVHRGEVESLLSLVGPKSYTDVQVFTMSFLEFVEGLGRPEAASAQSPAPAQRLTDDDLLVQLMHLRIQAGRYGSVNAAATDLARVAGGGGTEESKGRRLRDAYGKVFGSPKKGGATP